jgi:uncharacterized protein YbcI
LYARALIIQAPYTATTGVQKAWDQFHRHVVELQDRNGEYPCLLMKQGTCKRRFNNIVSCLEKDWSDKCGAGIATGEAARNAVAAAEAANTKLSLKMQKQQKKLSLEMQQQRMKLNAQMQTEMINVLKELLGKPLLGKYQLVAKMHYKTNKCTVDR